MSGDVRALSVLNDSVVNFRRAGDSRNALLASPGGGLRQ